MENAPLAVAEPPAADSLEHTPFKAWTMGKPRANSAEISLRVKPDRRRVQLPIPPELDRRRKR